MGRHLRPGPLDGARVVADSRAEPHRRPGYPRDADSVLERQLKGRSVKEGGVRRAQTTVSSSASVPACSAEWRRMLQRIGCLQVIRSCTLPILTALAGHLTCLQQV